jgi:hypothetical protein
MRKTSLALVGLAAATLASAGFAAASRAQPMDAPTVAGTSQGNWTLKQREDWLNNRLDKAQDDGSIDHHEFDRVHHKLQDIRDDEDQLRDHHDGQLTDNETAELEARLDSVAAEIHWLHENSFQKPW